MGGLGDELLTRYLVGEVTSDERALVEARMPQAELFEYLRALEEALILSYLKGDLPDSLRESFARRVLSNPARRRHVDSMRKAVTTLENAKAHGQQKPRRSWWAAPRSGFLAAATLAGVAIASTLLWRDAGREVPGATPNNIAQPIALFELQPGLSRSELQQANVFREAREGTARLRFTDPVAALPDMRLRLRPVGGTPLPVPRAGSVRAFPGGLEADWLVPAALLAPGDYLVSVDGRLPSGERETLASRFFSVVE